MKGAGEEHFKKILLLNVDRQYMHSVTIKKTLIYIFFQFDYTVRTEPETQESVMKHPPTDAIIATRSHYPTNRIVKYTSKCYHSGDGSGLKAEGNLAQRPALLLRSSPALSLGKTLILPIIFTSLKWS